MKCDQCDVSMRLNKQECSGNSCSYLFECEICGKVRLTSARVDQVVDLAIAGQAGNSAITAAAAPLDSMAMTEPMAIALLESVNVDMELPHVNLGDNSHDLQPVQKLPERDHGENHYELAFELAHQESEPELL